MLTVAHGVFGACGVAKGFHNPRAYDIGVSQRKGGTFLGIRIIRIIVFWGLYWGPLTLGNYHVEHASGLCFPVFSLKNVS